MGELYEEYDCVNDMISKNNFNVEMIIGYLNPLLPKSLTMEEEAGEIVIHGDIMTMNGEVVNNEFMDILWDLREIFVVGTIIETSKVTLYDPKLLS